MQGKGKKIFLAWLLYNLVIVAKWFNCKILDKIAFASFKVSLRGLKVKLERDLYSSEIRNSISCLSEHFKSNLLTQYISLKWIQHDLASKHAKISIYMIDNFLL